MDAVLDFIKSVPDIVSRKDDDVTDRLSNKYTVALLVVFSLVIAGLAFIGNPITCWAPQHFTDSHTTYANSYCWVKNTYYLPFDARIPREESESSRYSNSDADYETDDDEHIEKDYVTYYQWMPFILLGQALFFYIPGAIWNGLNQGGGVDADTILQAAQNFTRADQIEKRGDHLLMIQNQIDRFLVSRKSIHPSKRLPKEGTLRERLAKQERVSTRRFGCYLVIIYCFSKFLYLVNVVGQLYMLNSILSLNYHIYGIEVFNWMLENYDWTTSPQVAFPRVTMCDFKVRRLGNIHRYTVQCTLPINLYNEKIYMFLWFWMVFVAIVTAISLVTWILRIVSVSDRERYVQNHLKMMNRVDKQSNDVDDDTRRFVRSYLRHDGVFLLRLIGHNTNTLTVSEIIGALWDNRPEHLKSDKTISPTTEVEPSEKDRLAGAGSHG